MKLTQVFDDFWIPAATVRRVYVCKIPFRPVCGGLWREQDAAPWKVKMQLSSGEIFTWQFKAREEAIKAAARMATRVNRAIA